MKRTILFIILILILIAACVYYNCMQREKFNEEKELAIAAAVQKAVDSMNQHAILDPPKQHVEAHKPPPPPPEKKVKTKKPEEKNVLVDERDGQEYKIFQSGNGDWWMAQNLNFNSPGSWCYDLEDANCNEWGRLYTWEEALTVCPEGWHLPGDQEWLELINYYGGIHYAGKNLKEGGTSGFNVQFSGYRDKAGYFGKVNESAYFWSSTEQNEEYASFKGIYKSVDNVGTYTYPKKDGFSVRCVKDK
jgi:uncharacterized protein (TIGR02145 family)